PSTLPWMTTSRALMFARTRPCGPTIRLWSVNVTVPSTSPSRYRSSLPESSPRTNTDLPLCAISDWNGSFIFVASMLGLTGSAGALGFGADVGVAGLISSFPVVDSHTASSCALRHRFWRAWAASYLSLPRHSNRIQGATSRPRALHRLALIPCTALLTDGIA